VGVRDVFCGIAAALFRSVTFHRAGLCRTSSPEGMNCVLGRAGRSGIRGEHAEAKSFGLPLHGSRKDVQR